MKRPGKRRGRGDPAETPARRDSPLPFHRPTIGPEEIAEVAEVLRSGWLTTGRRVDELERALVDRLGCRAAVAVSSCTAALHLSLVAAGVGDGDEVITSPYTFASTGETILYTGARPVFVDVEEGTANIDVDRVAAAITPRTRAILPVHIGGYPCRVDHLNELAGEHELPVVEDAAHALGAAYRDRPIGQWSRFTCFSFYATKNLTTGEGGLLALTDERDVARVRRMSLHGLSRDPWKRHSQGGGWSYAIEELGYKYNMTDLAAAIGLCQLRRFDEEQRRRRERVAWYRSWLADCEALEFPPEPPEGAHAWHLFIVRLREGMLSVSRDEFARRLQEEQIGISVHFMPLHLHPLYQNRLGHRQGDFPVAEDLFNRAISLPLYPRMSHEDVEYVSGVVQRIASECRR